MHILLFTLVLGMLCASVIAYKGEHYAVRLHPQARPERVAARHGFRVVRPVANLAHHYLLERLPVAEHDAALAADLATDLATDLEVDLRAENSRSMPQSVLADYDEDSGDGDHRRRRRRTQQGEQHGEQRLWHRQQRQRQRSGGGGAPLHFADNPDEVHWFQLQTRRQQYHRHAIPLDPQYPSQWHLHGTPDLDVNVETVWREGIAGSGVTIAIVDDGLQYTHPDLADNYAAAGSYDYNSGKEDPTPVPGNGDDHGTSAAGVAAARANGPGSASYCGVGAAFLARVAGVRLISESTTDEQEASGISHAPQVNDIYSNSWGPTDDGKRLEGPGTMAALAMAQNVAEGRGGKGAIYIWAAGNGRSYGDNCNYDGWASSRYTIAVAAVDHQLRQAWYSESCAALLVSAPSSGNSISITTTDLLGADGTSAGDCTSSFGGTSAAAPLAAGVTALILEGNRNLTWRDVQHVYVRASRVVDEEGGDWQVNGGGLQCSHKYGYGLIDASAAVQLAKSWQNVGPAELFDSGYVERGIAIPEGGDGITVTHVVDADITIEHVEVIFSAQHPHRGELRVTLISPFGTKSYLAEPHGDVNANINMWKFTSTMCWGERSAGTWQLLVQDEKAPATQGTFLGWRLQLYGTM